VATATKKIGKGNAEPGGKTKTIRCMAIIATIVVFGCSLVLAGDNARKLKAEKCYQQALAYYETGQTDQAIRQLQEAVKLNKKFAAAYNKLALIYMEEGTVYGRFKATFALEKALKLQPKNIEFLFNSAILNEKKGFDRIAQKQFKKIIKLDPQNYRAYYHLGLLTEAEMLHYHDMINITPGSDGIIFMDSFAQRLKERATDWYQRAIAANPRFSDAYYRLALIYYEFDNYDEMVQLLESAVKIMPRDKNCHLFLGFAYQNSGNFDAAAREYQRAKMLMPEQEREALESIATILSPRQQHQYASASRAEKNSLKKNFWLSKDPFYLTEVNERELEHFSRVAYANLRFSRPEKKIPGWQTDRGRVFIRYGKPDQHYRTRAYLGSFTGHGRNPLHASKDIWIYPDFHFVFEDQYLSGNYTFAWGDLPGTDYKEYYEDMIKDYPDYYRLIPDSLLFEVPYDMVEFMGSGGRTALEYCFAIPAQELTDGELQSQDFTILQGIFLFDQFWNPVVKRTRQLLFRRQDLSEINATWFYSSRVPIEVRPGNYYCALEFEDQKTGKRSRLFREIRIDTFRVHRFQLSEIMFATDIKPPRINVAPDRSDFKITPNPLRVYRVGQPIGIYFEVYNLVQDRAGKTHFKIEYQIARSERSQPAIKRLLNKIGIIKRSGSVTAEYEYTGTSREELQYQTIMLNPEMKGEILIDLKVTDLLAGTMAERQEKFTVIE